MRHGMAMRNSEIFINNIVDALITLPCFDLSLVTMHLKYAVS